MYSHDGGRRLRRARSGDSRSRQRALDPDKAPMQGAPGSPTLAHELLKLQHAIGNAQVTRFIAAQRQEAADGDKGPGRRSNGPEVLRSPGTLLDSALREEVEAPLGAEFTSAQVNIDALAPR